MGKFIHWFIRNNNVYGFKFDGKWFDICDLNIYKTADDYFLQKKGDMK